MIRHQCPECGRDTQVTGPSIVHYENVVVELGHLTSHLNDNRRVCGGTGRSVVVTRERPQERLI